ncbi:helix-turn-helix domain-containing protein [[Clostridium] innocuum]|nr:helix-turn-helix domain-containing protein [[Clostridium] innocuum]
MQVDRSEGMINLDEVLTFTEAADKWGLADGKTIRKAVERGRFEPHEIKKSGNVWLTTYAAMQRVFGSPRTSPSVLYYTELYENTRERLERFFEEAGLALQRGDMISIVESREHPERIFCILKTDEELEGLQRRLKYFMKS